MVINVYKPRGWTSNDVVQKIKHNCGFKRVGHTGTLDPLAEGVLIVLTDEDTKRQNEFMNLTKEYLVKIAFGFESASHDLGTPVKPLDKEIADNLSQEVLGKALSKYVGKIQQQVPAYSAVHVQGRRLYKAARENMLTITSLPYKDIEIFDLEVCYFNNNERLDYPEFKCVCTSAEIRVICSKGTYVRALVRDLAKDLGCGAVVVSLLRAKIGEYRIDDTISVVGGHAKSLDESVRCLKD